MTDYIYANPEQHLLSITLTFYDGYKQKVRRTFPLRNLSEGTLAQQAAEAKDILNQFTAELRYLTAVGIDKGEIKAGRKKIDEILYPEYTPPSEIYPFMYGVNINFHALVSWNWVNTETNGYTPRLPREKINPQWQKKIWAEQKGKSLKLPCMIDFGEGKHFFKSGGPIKKKASKTQLHIRYDKSDEKFNRFIGRFKDEGNLCIGDDGSWINPKSDYLDITGSKWPQPKYNTTPHPRKKSYLASQPTDDTEYVYLIRVSRQKYYKIGKSNDPQGRLASLQSANPHKLVLVHTFRANNASAAEETLHAAFHTHRLEGEWFQLTDERRDAIKAITGFKDGRFQTNTGFVTAEELLQF